MFSILTRNTQPINRPEKLRVFNQRVKGNLRLEYSRVFKDPNAKYSNAGTRILECPCESWGIQDYSGFEDLRMCRADLYPVVKHAGSGRARKKCRFFPTS